MGSILINSIRFQIYSKDHGPAHVHVSKDGAEVVVEIRTLKIRKSKGFTDRAVKLILETIKQNERDLMQEWERLHEGK
jgi:transcriptional regulator of NAD metabolism